MSIHVPPRAQPVERCPSAPATTSLDRGRRGQARDHAVGRLGDRARRGARRARRPRRAPAAAVASRSCTVSGKPAASTRAARWRPRLPRPTKPTFTARRAARDARRPAARGAGASPLVGVRERDLLVELDAEARRRRRDHVAVLPADRRLAGARRGSRPSARSPRGSGSSGVQARAGCSPRRRPARSRGAARSARSAPRPSPAIFLASSRPPTRPRFICRIEAAPVSSTRANSYLVVSRSPVAIGIDVARATRAISSGASGGVGSSNQSGSKRSSRRARRIAPEAVNCPCVPKSRSQRVADRLADLRRRSARSGRASSSEGWRGSNDAYGPAGSNLSAVKPERGVLRGALAPRARDRCRRRSRRRAPGRGRCRRAAARARARRAARRPACRPPCRRCPSTPSRCR